MSRITPEGRVKGKINRTLKRFTKIYKFMPVPTGYGARTLDYLLCINGFFVGIEAKAPGKDLTDIQKTTRDEIVLAGGIVFRVRDDEELETFEKFLVDAGCEPLN